MDDESGVRPARELPLGDLRVNWPPVISILSFVLMMVTLDIDAKPDEFSLGNMVFFAAFWAGIAAAPLGALWVTIRHPLGRTWRVLGLNLLTLSIPALWLFDAYIGWALGH